MLTLVNFMVHKTVNQEIKKHRGRDKTKHCGPSTNSRRLMADEWIFDIYWQLKTAGNPREESASPPNVKDRRNLMLFIAYSERILRPREPWISNINYVDKNCLAT